MPMAGGGGGGGSSSAIEAGRATVRLNADQAGLKSDLDKARRMVLGWGKNIAAAGGGLLGAGGSVLGGIGAAFKSVVNKFDSVKEAADRLGTSTEIISELGYAAEKAGSDFDGMESAMKFLNINLVDAPEKFEQFGLSAEKLLKMDIGERVEEVAEAFSKLNGETASLAGKELLGKAGPQLLALLKKGGDNLRQQRQIARDVGSSISGADAAKADQIADDLHDSWTAVKNTFLAVGAALLPQVDRLNMLRNVIVSSIGSVREFINNNREMVLGITLGAAAVAAVGVALVALGSSLAIASFAVGGLMTAWGVLTAVVAASVSPLAIVVVGLAAAAAVFTLLFVDLKKLEDFGGGIANAFAPIVDTIKETFGGIGDAIKNGNIELAFEVMVAGLEVIWEDFMIGMRTSWKKFQANSEKPTESVGEFLGSGVRSIEYLFTETALAVADEIEDMFDTPSKDTIEQRIHDASKRASAFAEKETVANENAVEETNIRKARRDALKAVLAAKIAEAALPKPQKEILPMPREIVADKADKLIQSLSELGSSRGGFGGANASAKFGVGDVQQKQLKELEGIHKEVKKKGGGLVVAAD